MTAEDRYYFRDGHTYKCLKCGKLTQDRWTHITVDRCCCSYMVMKKKQ